MRLDVKSTAFNHSLTDLIVSMIYGCSVTSQPPAIVALRGSPELHPRSVQPSRLPGVGFHF